MTSVGTKLLAAAALALCVTLSGCTSQPLDIDESVGHTMQTTVVMAANQAASGDSSTALLTLDTLQIQLQQAIEGRQISAERAALVQESLDVVRADLQPAETPTSPNDLGPTETPPDDTNENGNGNGNGNGNNGNGNGNNGNGNNGNGNNGNGKKD